MSKLTGLQWQLIGAQKSVNTQFLTASCVPWALVQELVLLNAFTHDQDDEVEHTHSKFVGDAKFLRVDDGAAVEESHQSFYLSIFTTALSCGLLTPGQQIWLWLRFTDPFLWSC